MESWLEEIDRLSDVTGKTNIAVAIFTARGSLYNHIKELQNNKLEWDVIKQKLLERFSEFVDLSIHGLPSKSIHQK